LALSAVVTVLWCALLVLCLLATWCALLLGVSASVVVVALAAVGEPVPFVVGMSACLAVVEPIVGSPSKSSVAVTLTVLLRVTTLSSAVWGSPVVMTERGRAHVLSLRVKRLQVAWVSQ
jgi:hypothetical protein